MKKSNVRDYAVSAFRYYAAAQKNNKPVVFPENNRLASGCILDLIAVEKTLRSLEISAEGMEKLKALETVYFTAPERELKKGEISDRVSFAAQKIHVSEPTVYRFLNGALTEFAENRGLRIALF